eukprot:SAG31_NODE_12623_length_929_cov_0.763855_2_plen_69_part_01
MAEISSTNKNKKLRLKIAVQDLNATRSTRLMLLTRDIIFPILATLARRAKRARTRTIRKADVLLASIPA